MSTTTKLKPRPIRKAPKKMTEQTYSTPAKVTITDPSPITLTKVQSHLPDVQLISKDALWEDFQNRVKINNYELKEVMKELKSVVSWTEQTYKRFTS